jgi:hypothetical protein
MGTVQIYLHLAGICTSFSVPSCRPAVPPLMYYSLVSGFVFIVTSGGFCVEGTT